MARNPLFYCDAQVSQVANEDWLQAVHLFRQLPPTSQMLGREKSFAQFLNATRVASIKELTTDELSEFLSASPRNLSSLTLRDYSEILVAEIQSTMDTVLDIHRLCQWASAATGTPQTVRKSRHFTERDSQGRAQEFVPPELLEVSLNEIFQVWNEHSVIEDRVPKSIWIMVALLNAHAFPNGNGRLARAAFNAQFGRLTNSAHGPLPLAPMVYAASGNFELAIGRAALLGQWDPVVRTVSRQITYYVNYYAEFEAHGKNHGD